LFGEKQFIFGLNDGIFSQRLKADFSSCYSPTEAVFNSQKAILNESIIAIFNQSISSSILQL